MLKRVRERASKDIATDPAKSAAAATLRGLGSDEEGQGLVHPQAQQAPRSTDPDRSPLTRTPCFGVRRRIVSPTSGRSHQSRLQAVEAVRSARNERTRSTFATYCLQQAASA